MNINQVFVVTTFFLIKITASARLHKLFQFIDGFRSEHNLEGFLHIGNDYAIFLRAPKPHDKHLIYELYEVKNIPDSVKYRPRLLAISQVPVDYIKDQLKVYRRELFIAKYENVHSVPGVQVRTLREWQIQKSLDSNNKILKHKMPILRSIV